MALLGCGRERNDVISEPCQQVVAMDTDHGSHPSSPSEHVVAQQVHAILVSDLAGQELGEGGQASSSVFSLMTTRSTYRSRRRTSSPT